MRRVVDGLELSPFSANIRALGETFQDADLERTENDQIQTLEEVDEDGSGTLDFDEFQEMMMG